jgi:hypothetical protein
VAHRTALISTLYIPVPEFESLGCVVADLSAIALLQPPLPLQSFLPLQPLALDLQPPMPLQSFWPLQSCLAGCVVESSRVTGLTPLILLLMRTVLALVLIPEIATLLLVAKAADPANRPPIAAALIDAIFVVRDIEEPFCKSW